MSSFIEDQEKTPEPPLSELCLNLENKFSDMQEMNKAEGMHVYARIRPMLESEIKAGYKECIGLIDDQVIRAVVPAHSAKYKMTSHLTQDIIEDFSFSSAYGPETGQFVLFEECMMETMRNFIEGQNNLLFSYGTTGSGKTFTLHGNTDNPGIIPLSLHLFFASIEDQLFDKVFFKPDRFADVVGLNDNEMKKMLEVKDQLMSSCSQEEWSVRNSSTNKSFGLMLCDTFSEKFEGEGRETTLCPEEMAQAQAAALMKDISKKSAEKQSGLCSVWVSFVEIYNETIYDLLQSNVNQRTKLTLGEDKNGDVYVKGLREVCVSNASEALKLLNFGQRNLKIASTKLNYQSSRSHCIFTIKVIRMPEPDNMNYARVNRLSFCDLAGSERAAKSQTTGLRLKEAGCINTSLMVLGRCLEQLRLKPSLRDKKLIPFRESKLTRLFSGFFTGRGKAVMITNVSPSELTFDETLHVLRFSALAKELIINDSYIATASSTLQSITNMWTNARANGKDSSCASDKSIGFEDSMEEVLQEKDELIEKLLDLAESLRNNLEQEKKERAELEIKIRQDVYQEYSEYSDGLLAMQKQAFEEERESMKEIYQKRISSMEQMYEKIISDYKLQLDEIESSSDEESSTMSETKSSVKKARVSQVFENSIQDGIAENSDLGSLTKKLEDTQLLLQNAMKNSDDLKRELDAYKIDCLGYKTSNDDLLRQKIELEQDLKLLREDLATISQEKKELSLELTDTITKRNLLRDEMQNFDERINLKEESIARYKELIEKANTGTNLVKGKLSAALDELKKERGEKRNLELLKSMMEEKISELESAEQNSSETKSVVDALTKEIDIEKNKTSDLEKALKEIKEVLAELDSLKSAHDMCNDTISELQITKLNLEEKLSSVSKELDIEKNKTSDLEKALKEMKEVLAELDSLKSAHDMCNDTISELQITKLNLEEKLSSVSKELESGKLTFKEECDILQRKLDATQSALEKSNDELENLTVSNNSAKVTIAELQIMKKEMEEKIYSHGTKAGSSGLTYAEVLRNGLDSRAFLPSPKETMESTVADRTRYFSEENKIEVNQAEETIKKLENDLEKLAASSEKKIGELERLNSELEEKISSHSSQSDSEDMTEKNELVVKLHEAEETVKKLQNDLETLVAGSESKISQLEKMNQELEEKINSYTSQSDSSDSTDKNELTEKLNQAEETVKKLQNDLENLGVSSESKISQLEKMNQELEEKINSYTSQSDSLYRLVQVLENCELIASRRIAESESEKLDYKEKLVTTSTDHAIECSTLLHLIEILEKCEAFSSSRIKKFHSSTIKHVEEILDFKKTIKRNEEIIEGLNTDKCNLQKQIKDLQASSKKQLQQFTTTLEDTKKSLSKAEELNASLKNTVGEYRAAMEKLEAKNKNLDSEKGKFEIENTILKTEKEELEMENKNLKSEEKNLEKENRNLRSGKKVLETENTNLRSEKQALETENRSLRSGKEILETENRKLRSRKEVLETEKRNSKSEKEVLETEKRNSRFGKEELETEKRNSRSGKEELETKNRNSRSGKEALETEDRNSRSGKEVHETEGRNVRSRKGKPETDNSDLKSEKEIDKKANKKENAVEEKAHTRKCSKTTKQGDKRKNKQTEKSEGAMEDKKDKKQKTKIYEETDENSNNDLNKEKRVGRRQLRCLENVVEEKSSVHKEELNFMKGRTLKRKEQDQDEDKLPQKNNLKKVRFSDSSDSENMPKPQNLRVKLLKAAVVLNDITVPSPRMTRGRRRLVQAKQNISMGSASPRTVRS